MKKNLNKLKAEKNQPNDTTTNTTNDYSNAEELNEEILRLKRKINIIIKDNET